MSTSDCRAMMGLSLFAAMLVACSGEGTQQAKADAGSGEDAVATGVAASPERLRCPPRVREGLPGPDMTGIRLGMGADEALATARCALGEDALVKTSNRWLDRLDTFGVELGTQTFTVQQGDSKPCDYRRNLQGCGFGNREWEHVDEVLVVATPGAPGRETAMVVWRTQNFRDGAMPAVEALAQALVDKYGEPQYVESSDKRSGRSSGYRELRWLQDHRGQPLAPPNPMFRQCMNTLRGRGESTQVSWRAGCGLSLRAQILRSGDNPGLAMEMDTAMVNQGELHAHDEATRAELRQQGQLRREAEVQQAGDAGDVRL